jgi:hypothetical protein
LIGLNSESWQSAFYMLRRHMEWTDLGTRKGARGR